MPNHMQSRASMVVKGTAPEECSPQMKKLRKKPMPKTMLGYSMAVCREGVGKGMRRGSGERGGWYGESGRGGEWREIERAEEEGGEE